MKFCNVLCGFAASPKARLSRRGRRGTTTMSANDGMPTTASILARKDYGDGVARTRVSPR